MLSFNDSCASEALSAVVTSFSWLNPRFTSALDAGIRLSWIVAMQSSVLDVRFSVLVLVWWAMTLSVLWIMLLYHLSNANSSNHVYFHENNCRVSHNRLPGCPGQPFLPVGQPKIDPWLPDRATRSFTICLYIYVVGQPKCLVGQPQFDTGCPTGQPVFRTNVKPWTGMDSPKQSPYFSLSPKDRFWEAPAR